MSEFALPELKAWFIRKARVMPWREDPNPYAVWISEVMLQQTRVSVVIPYFERWMQQFPTISQLASAPLDSVIKAWEGLGYYSRARNLHLAAKQIMEHHQGTLPDSEVALQRLKGLGPYTIGAIRAFAFKQRAAAVDGNVVRVLARHDLISDDIGKPSTLTAIRKRALEILPEAEPWVIAEALIELGATVCNRKPNCIECPLQGSCKAFRRGTMHLYPVKKTKISIQALTKSVAVIMADGHALVKRCESGKVMSDLHEFPSLPTDMGDLHPHLESLWTLELHPKAKLKEIQHSYTRYKVTLLPTLYSTPSLFPIPGYFWHPIATLNQLAFSAGHRQLLSQLPEYSL